MSIDKFGRLGLSHGALPQGPKGEGFSLTADGDYDMCNRRLCNVGEPTHDDDAVNLKHLHSIKESQDKLTSDRLTEATDRVLKEVNNKVDFNRTKAGDYNFKRRRLCNIGESVDDSDAVNLKRIRTMNNERDSQLSSQLTEAVNKVVDEVNTKVAFSKTSEGDYDFKKQRLCNIAEARDDSDAVSFGAVKKLFDGYKESLKAEFDNLDNIQAILDNEVGKYYHTLSHRLDKLEGAARH